MSEKTYCQCKCGHKHIIDLREICFHKNLAIALAQVYKWCLEKDRHEFQRKEIQHLLIGLTNNATWGDLIYFGGLVYRPEGAPKGTWGLHMDRCRAFFNGKIALYTKVLKDPITKKIVEHRDMKHISQLPEIFEHLNRNGLYDPNYISRNLFKDEVQPDEIKIKEI